MEGGMRIFTRILDAVLTFAGGAEETFDKVVIAAHADEALSLLEDPSQEETACLSPWRYNRNTVVLHTDPSFLPETTRARASWNYLREKDASPGGPVMLTYHMNRLQGLRTENEYCVTLNPLRPVEPSRIIRELVYRHPMFTAEAVATTFPFAVIAPTRSEPEPRSAQRTTSRTTLPFREDSTGRKYRPATSRARRLRVTSGSAAMQDHRLPAPRPDA
jgi:predicted NAD/FAD-binding protein